MARFNPDFWEIPTDNATLERVQSTDALWYETEEDRDRRHAMSDFYKVVKPVVDGIMSEKLTKRQSEVIQLYYVHGKTQEDIAAILNLSQSTVSRHLFGTVRGGKKVGGAIPKLQKAVNTANSPEITSALENLHQRLAEAV